MHLSRFSVAIPNFNLYISYLRDDKSDQQRYHPTTLHQSKADRSFPNSQTGISRWTAVPQMILACARRRRSISPLLFSPAPPTSWSESNISIIRTNLSALSITFRDVIGPSPPPTSGKQVLISSAMAPQRTTSSVRGKKPSSSIVARKWLVSFAMARSIARSTSVGLGFGGDSARARGVRRIEK